MSINDDLLTDLRRDRWHVGKEIPLALIIGMVLQAFGLVWWTSYWTTTLDNRVAALERREVEMRARIEERADINARRIDGLAANQDRVIRLEERLLSMNEVLQEIRQYLREQNQNRPL